MYSDITKSQAFLLYCNGVSFRQIAETLKTHPGCESITHSTVKKWSETPDDKGLTWADRKSEYMAVVAKTEKDIVIRTRTDVLIETDKILNSILTEIGGESLEFKTKDAAIYAFRSLADWSEKIRDKDKRISMEDQVTLIFDAMREIPAVAKVLEENWTQINVIWQKKAKELLLKKRHE